MFQVAFSFCLVPGCDLRRLLTGLGWCTNEILYRAVLEAISAMLEVETATNKRPYRDP